MNDDVDKMITERIDSGTSIIKRERETRQKTGIKRVENCREIAGVSNRGVSDNNGKII